MPFGCAVMKTDVPLTRAGGMAVTAATKSSMGTARAVRRSATRRRPVFHVVISVSSDRPMTSGSHPPCATFTRFAAKNATSTNRKSAQTPNATRRGQCQRSVATVCSSSTVMIMVSATAMP